MKITVEKITKEEPLTLEEQQKLLDNLVIAEALIVGFENYCKSIGKSKEAREYVGKFMEEVTKADMENAFVESDGKA